MSRRIQISTRAGMRRYVWFWSPSSALQVYRASAVKMRLLVAAIIVVLLLVGIGVAGACAHPASGVGLEATHASTWTHVRPQSLSLRPDVHPCGRSPTPGAACASTWTHIRLLG